MNIDKIEFESRTANFHPGNAYTLGKAAALSYKSEAAVRAKLKLWGLPNCQFIDLGETQAFVAGNDEIVIVAFRGTEPSQLRDWVTDAQAALTAGAAGRVHRGFHRALDNAWREVRGAITAIQNKGQSLWFTGHSLGAALATLAVASLRLESDKAVHGLYTFGQPRVGDREFELRFNMDFKAQCFRFVNNNDIVTRVPLRVMGYSHVGTFLYFDAKGQVSADRGHWFRFLDGVEGRIADLGKLGPDDAKDHSMEKGYLPNLARLNNPFA